MPRSSEKPNSKTLLLLLGASLLSACTSGAGAKGATPDSAPAADPPPVAEVKNRAADRPTEDPAPYIARAAAEFDGKVPMMVDNETRLDLVAGTEKELYYRYTLVNLMPGDISVDELTTGLRQMLLTQACTRPETGPILDNGARVRFAYRWKNGTAALDFSFTENECP